MAAEKISVVVPVYNQGRYLGACLDSVWFQDWPNLEIVVVCDPSPDDTLEVLEAFERDVRTATVSHAAFFNETTGEVERAVEPRYRPEGRELTVLRNARRLGHSASYNLGFRAAGGAYCTYVAADDICHPGMLTALAAPLQADQADFAYSDMFVVDDAGRILREFRLPDYSFARSFGDWYLCGVSKLYRRELHERHGYFREDYLANDHECYLRFALGGARFVRVPKVLYSVRSHEERNVDVHSKGNWKRLFEESKRLVRVARER